MSTADSFFTHTPLSTTVTAKHTCVDVTHTHTRLCAPLSLLLSPYDLPVFLLTRNDEVCKGVEDREGDDSAQ